MLCAVGRVHPRTALTPGGVLGRPAVPVQVEGGRSCCECMAWQFSLPHCHRHCVRGSLLVVPGHHAGDRVRSEGMEPKEALQVLCEEQDDGTEQHCCCTTSNKP